MEFIEAPAFTRHLAGYLSDEGYRELQAYLAENPEGGDLIQGTGGFRKLRWSDSRRGKGKRGGLRLIYFVFSEDEQIWLLTLYDKNEADDLSPVQKKALKEAVDAEKYARAKPKKNRMERR
jgi:mRNA-degrading endonuclease RelE of RelBE toxin-antitoxin system